MQFPLTLVMIVVSNWVGPCLSCRSQTHTHTLNIVSTTSKILSSKSFSLPLLLHCNTSLYAGPHITMGGSPI